MVSAPGQREWVGRLSEAALVKGQQPGQPSGGRSVLRDQIAYATGQQLVIGDSFKHRDAPLRHDSKRGSTSRFAGDSESIGGHRQSRGRRRGLPIRLPAAEATLGVEDLAYH